MASYSRAAKQNLTAPPFVKTNPTAPLPATNTVRNVLAGNGIAGAHFGQSPARVRAVVRKLLDQPGGRYTRTGGCGFDHLIMWSALHAPATATLTAYFSHSRFVGYSYGQYGARPAPGLRGIVLASARGLKVGDTLARGQRLYGSHFRLSTSQGGTWNVGTANGPIDGFAFGNPKHGDITPHSLVATIDAGNVGCSALSP